MVQTLLSIVVFLLFLGGIGTSSIFPSFRMVQDTQLDLSLFPSALIQKALALLWVLPTGLGFLGWARKLEPYPSPNGHSFPWMGLTLAVGGFSLYVFGLGINGLLFWPLVLLFFVPFLRAGWMEWGQWRRSPPAFRPTGFEKMLLAMAIALWGFEFLSPPIIWDAVLDHFRYAEEVARMHRIPFHWVNHTGDMPKAAEAVLAGFWSLGGETLSKFSLSLAAILMAGILGVFAREIGLSPKWAWWAFLSCPFFMALFSWGYVEGFLAVYETAALFCFWKSLQDPKHSHWMVLSFLLWGMAFSIKYTAVLGIGACLAAGLFFHRNKKKLFPIAWVLISFLVPIFPWLLKNWMANGDPFYPLGTSIFGAPPGYGPRMESDLWQDTGRMSGFHPLDPFVLLMRSFFTPATAVGAVWTPLVFMGLPWLSGPIRERSTKFLIFYVLLFFLLWGCFCTSLRHAAGATVVIVLLSAMGWEFAIRNKKPWSRGLFFGGACLSLWLCFSAQTTNTAPYASALGLEDQARRLKRNYSMDLDTFAAYRDIEKESTPDDKVMAFAVFQTFQLQRTSYVDFFWKGPIFLQWASQCTTGSQLAQKLKEEGITYFLYQQGEAERMFFKEKNFELSGMSEPQYADFWRFYMQPVAAYDNSFVYRVLDRPAAKPFPLLQLPGIQEQWLGPAEKAVFQNRIQDASKFTLDLAHRYPDLGSVWVEKALIEDRLSMWKETVESGQKALLLDANSTELDDALIDAYSHRNEPDMVSKISQMKERWVSYKEAAIQRALAFYTGI